MRRLTLLSLACALMAVAGPAGATELRARRTADVLEPGVASIGLLDPLRYGWRESLELETHPLLTLLLSPNLTVRKRHLRGEGLTLTGEYGLAVPTLAMRLAQGYLFPSWKTSGNQVGWFVVPSAGAVASLPLASGILSVREELAVGIPLGRNDARPLETWTFLELVFAPALTGFRNRAGIVYDYPLASFLRLRAGLDFYLIGPSPSPPRSQVVWGGEVAVDVALRSSLRLVVGVHAWNADQRRKDVIKDEAGRSRRVAVRSTDLLPVADLIWTF